VILVVPPGHAFAGRQVTLDELRGEHLILMQEGAGVRQVIEDELRGGPLRLRDLDVRLELARDLTDALILAGNFERADQVTTAAIEAAGGKVEPAPEKARYAQRKTADAAPQA
jgi:DNA-binding transcriptional LysR family regulator